MLTGQGNDLGCSVVVSSAASATRRCGLGGVGEGGLFVLPVGLAFDDGFPGGSLQPVDGGLG